MDNNQIREVPSTVHEFKHYISIKRVWWNPRTWRGRRHMNKAEMEYFAQIIPQMFPEYHLNTNNYLSMIQDHPLTDGE